MKRSFAIALTVVLLALTTFSQDKTKAAPKGEAGTSAQVEKAIRQAWQDFKDKKKDAYAAALADDFTAVENDGNGPRDKKTAVNEADAVNLSSFTLTDMKVTPLGSGAMATYRAKVNGTVGKQPLNQNLAVIEVWKNAGGQWKCLRYQETEVK